MDKQVFDPDYDWIYDLVIEIISSPEFRNPIKDFIDENCDSFVGTEENTLDQGKIFKNFNEFIDSLLASFIIEIGISEEMFILAAKKAIENPKNKMHKKYILQLISFTNYLYFKNLMTKRNIQLEQQALKLLNESNNNNIKVNNNNLNNIEKIVENNIQIVEQEEIKKINNIKENDIKNAIINNKKLGMNILQNEENNNEINNQIQNVNFNKNSKLNEIRKNIKIQDNKQRENDLNKNEILIKKNTLRQKLQDNLTKFDRIKFAVENNLNKNNLNNYSNNNDSNNNNNNNNNEK